MIHKLIEILTRTRLKNEHHLYAFLVLALFSITSLILLLHYGEMPQTLPDRHTSYHKVEEKLQKSILEETEVGCKFPVIDPFAAEMMKFNKDIPKIKCESGDWVQCEMSKCYVKSDILKTMNNVVCVYKDIIYIDDNNYKLGEPVRVSSDRHYYLNASDHVKVSCSGTPVDRFNIFSTRWYGYKAGLRPVQLPPAPPSPAAPGANSAPPAPPGSPSPPEDDISVMILCFDSTSHNGFRRRMPHSYKALQEMDAVIMQGYNIVGDGTPAAIIPLLTGKTELDMPEMRKRFANSKAVDPENYIFKMLSKYGYRTAFFEDSPWIGTFQYRYNGFSSQPADHYMQAFLQEETKYGAKWWNGINKRHCIGDTPQYGFLMNMSKQVTSLAQKHFCFTFIVDISHDDFNMISSADDDLVAFIEHMRDSGKMENHLFIVMGDHGSRFSGLRETYQGKIEERLPLMAIMLPEKLIQTRPETLTSLRNNARVLTTPFDIHTTVVHAMGLPQLANDYVILGSDIPRGMSLLEPIPQSRTCGKAGILSHWCVCSKWYPVSTADKLYTEAGVALAHFVNNVTYEVRSKCVDRKLTFIDWVMKLSNNDDVLSFKSGIECNGRHETYVKADVKSRPSVEYYQAKIRMTPGRALFEGTMKYNVNTGQFVVSDSDIQRITAYADEPACISKTHPHLNKYCYCKNKASRIPFM